MATPFDDTSNEALVVDVESPSGSTTPGRRRTIPSQKHIFYQCRRAGDIRLVFFCFFFNFIYLLRFLAPPAALPKTLNQISTNEKKPWWRPLVTMCSKVRDQPTAGGDSTPKWRTSVFTCQKSRVVASDMRYKRFYYLHINYFFSRQLVSLISGPARILLRGHFKLNFSLTTIE